PVFLIIFLGIFLKKINIIDEIFVKISSRLVFSVALPALVFTKLYAMDFQQALDFKQILFIYCGILFFYGLIWFTSIPFITEGRDRAVFIQGSFRSNYAIIGFAVIQNMFGEHALVKASVILAFIMPLYNFLSIVALTVPVRKEKGLNLTKTVIEIFTNPLILAALISIIFSYFKIPVHPVILKTGNYLAAMALPLALIDIGGSLNLKNISRLAIITTFIKLILIPSLLTFGAYRLGYRGEDLVLMFLLFATPTAIASFIMAEAMDCNGQLASDIVVISTLTSILTISVGIFILKSLKLF
ncbi:MAG: AEC family transporter, partial [Bacteroidetes bacterium]